MKTNKKIIIFLINVFVIVMAMRSFAFTFDDYRKKMLNDAVKNMNKDNKGSIIFSWDDTDNNSHAYRNNALIGFNNEVIENVKDNEESEYVNTDMVTIEKANVTSINTEYVFKTDKVGNVGIAYINVATGSPVLAMDGFYIVKKIDSTTNKERYAKYYVDSAGYVLSGWIECEGKKYYLSESDTAYGEVTTGELSDIKDGTVYVFDNDGVLIDIKRRKKGAK